MVIAIILLNQCRGRIAWSGSSVELDADRGLWSRYLGV